MSLNATNLYIQASQLPATFKGSPNDLFSEMIKRMKILSPSGTNFIFIGDTEPTSNVGPWLKNGTQWYVWDTATKKYVPQDISASFVSAFSVGNSVPATLDPPLWLQTTKNAADPKAPDYGVIIRMFSYDFTLAMWVAPHPSPASGAETRMYKGAEADVWAYDGGDGVNPTSVLPTATSGAMWEVDHAFDFKVPIGPGTNSTTYGGNPATTVGVGGIGGEEQHVLTAAEMPSHTHTVTPNMFVWPLAGGVGIDIPGNNSAGFQGVAYGTTSAGSDASHNTMPPYCGVYFIKRTARVFYTP
jgi:hypothetical protein